jgi:hypothetical protein
MPRSSLTKISTVISLACLLGAASLSQRSFGSSCPNDRSLSIAWS